MKSLSILTTFILISCVATSQKLQRAFSFGNASEEHGRKIAYDSQGNMFVVGSFRGNNMDLDPSSSTFNLSSLGDWDIFIAKYDSYGIFLNAISIGGLQNDQATSIAVDNSDNIYVTGWFRGTVDFNPGSGVANVISNGHSGTDMGYDGEIFLAKYSNDLSYSWAFGIGGPMVNDAGLAVKIDKQGDVILAGNFRGTNIDFDPSSNVANLSASGVIESFIAKYTAAGNYVWAKGIGGASTVSGQVRDIAIDDANNIYAVGHFDGSVDLNPGSSVNAVTSAGCGDIYLLKLSASGDYKWGFKIGGGNCDYPVSIVLDKTANVYISGYFSSSNVDFNPGSTINTLSTTGISYDIFMAKYDSSGAYVFAKKAGGVGADIGYDMAIRSDGIVLVGYFANTVDFDPSSATNALSSSNDSNDGFIAHYTFDGQYVSAFKLGSTGEDAVYGVYADSNDVVTVTGFFNRTNVDFDPSAGKYYLSNSGTTNDVFVAKYYDLDLRNVVKGSVYLDRNLNGSKDSDDPYFPGAKLISIKNNEDSVVTISSNGRFAFAIDTGQYITTAILPVPYYSILPGSDTTNFTTYMNNDSISFAIQPIPGIKDLTVTAFALTPARPGFPINYKLLYGNKGTDTIFAASLHFVRDSRLNFDSASIDPSTVGDTLKWEFPNIPPRTLGGIVIYLKASVPPSLNNGDTLSSQAVIYPVSGDSTSIDNAFTLDQMVTGSYDPNDKRESHGGKITTTQVSEGEFLQYTIRFQNTGTDTAFNISIRDTLSGKLDWNSFEMISSSHDYQLTISDNSKCLWEFSNINLVDSNKNESLSHGYIVFKIKPKSTLIAGDVITNQASIYFDFNLPIETNTEQTVVEIPSVLPLKLISFTAKRTGSYNQLKWITSNEMNVSHFEIQRSSNGRDFKQLGKVISHGRFEQQSYEFNDNQPFRSANYYRLKLVDKDGKSQLSAVRLINNESTLFAEVYPNPVNDILNLRISSEKRLQAELTIIGLDGKTYMSRKLALDEGITLSAIDIKSLNSGAYFVSVKTDGEMLTIKFVK